MSSSCVAFWFRRDLRLDDNAGLYAALHSGKQVVPVFIFDRHILDELPEADARVEFIHDMLTEMQDQLTGMDSSLVVRYGMPEEIWPELIREYALEAIYTNHDFEPYARQRDESLREWLADQGIGFETYKDQVIFEKQEILTNNGDPYSVFTPYSKKWKSHLTSDRLASYDTVSHFGQLYSQDPIAIPSLEAMGFKRTSMTFPSRIPDQDIIKVYHDKRNFPAEPGTTRIGVHLRFGTISIRKLARLAYDLNETYLNELIWREFYMQILWNFPHVVEGPYRREYAAVKWLEDHAGFEKWCQGKTGFPIVDAGMRELNETGYMHNRVRMIVASFLTKDLLINWQWGERYFAEKLLDFELSSNNGGWQWAAGCGTDAAPYFRIFNPDSQTKKFDPQGTYIRKWVPEFGTPAYPQEIVNHKFARERTLDAYKFALGKA